MLDNLRARGFEVSFASHAAAILSTDFPEILENLERALLSVRLPIAEIVGSGGGEAQVTQRLRREFQSLEWRKRNIEMTKVVDGVEKESITHEIDHFCVAPNGNFALEIEWNNKDPFFDRDLENFKRLHAEGVIGVGSIITRGSGLQEGLQEMIRQWAEHNRIESFDDLRALGFKRPTERQEQIVEARMQRQEPFAEAWAAMFTHDKYGASTTHWAKLQARIQRGVGNPCPLLLIGMPRSIVDMG